MSGVFLHLIQIILNIVYVCQSVSWLTSLLILYKWSDISSFEWDICLKFVGDIFGKGSGTVRSGIDLARSGELRSGQVRSGQDRSGQGRMSSQGFSSRPLVMLLILLYWLCDIWWVCTLSVTLAYCCFSEGQLLRPLVLLCMQMRLYTEKWQKPWLKGLDAWDLLVS